MPKKRTYKTKSRNNKKSGFFTKRKIALGVALIALVGIGVVLYSNAAVGDPPVEKNLFCAQGNCYETEVQGTQRAPQKSLVRETNKLTCASTGKEWALKREAANKQGNQWVCLQSEDPNAPLIVPANFRLAETPCYKTVIPPTTTINPGIDVCQPDYSNDTLGQNITVAYDQNNYLVRAEQLKQFYEGEGSVTRSFNKDFVLNGQKAVRLVTKISGNNSVATVSIIVDTPSVQASVHPTTVITYAKFLNTAPGSTQEKANIATDITMAQWQWNNLLTQTTSELTIANCFKTTAPSVSTTQSNTCTTSGNAIKLIPNQPIYNIEFSFVVGGSANLNYKNLADSFASGYENRGYVIEDRDDDAIIGGLAAVSYIAVKPNEPNTRELLIFPDRKNAQNGRFFMRAKTYGPFMSLQDEVLASWQWL